MRESIGFCKGAPHGAGGGGNNTNSIHLLPCHLYHVIYMLIEKNVVIQFSIDLFLNWSLCLGKVLYRVGRSNQGACHNKQTDLACENIKSTVLHGFPSIRSIAPLNNNIFSHYSLLLKSRSLQHHHASLFSPYKCRFGKPCPRSINQCIGVLP